MSNNGPDLQDRHVFTYERKRKSIFEETLYLTGRLSVLLIDALGDVVKGVRNSLREVVEVNKNVEFEE